MDKLVDKTVPLDLTSINGNAYSLMGHFRVEARKNGWTHDEIDIIIEEATSRDYDYLVSTLSDYCNEPKKEI